MRVDVVETKISTYVFTEEEQEYLMVMGIWDLLLERLEYNERVEIE